MEIENEFSLKDLFFYALKRWLIVIIVAAIGAVGFFASFYVKDRYQDDTLQVSAEFYSITEFVNDNGGVGAGLDTAIDSMYSRTQSNVLWAMNDEFVKSSALTNGAFIKEMSDLLDLMAKTKRTEPYEQEALNKAFYEMTSFSVGSAYVVTMSGKFDTAEKKTHIKKLLDLYIDIAIAHSYSKNAVNAGSIKKNQIVDIIVIKEPTSLMDYGMQVVYGGLAGVAVGVMILVLIYFLDGRVKSYDSQMSSFGGGLIAKAKTNEVEESPLLCIASRMKNSKVLLVASGCSDPFTASMADKIAEKFSEVGLKGLHINLCQSADGTLIEALDGKAEAKETNGYYTLGVKSPKDWTILFSKTLEFKKLCDKFDKVIISYCDSYDGGAVVLKDFVDKVLYVINQKQTRFVQIKSLAEDLSSKESLALGTYIYDLI